MNLRLDPDSPIPLYHQIAEALRYRIATGRWKPGQVLPTVRQGASDWGVHLHTVRRAYAELARDGLVESQGARGTRVVEGSGELAKGELDAFLARILHEARRRHGLAPRQLADLLLKESAPRVLRPVVHVVECSESQCEDLARQLEVQWNVHAKPWPLDRVTEPPAGAVVATFFHYNEIRRLWPQRLVEIQFTPIQPDPSLAKQFPPARGRTTVELCEFDASKAENIVADLSVLLPADRYHIVPQVVRRADERLAPRRRRPILFAPRVYAQLSSEQKARPGVHEVRYVILGSDLERIGEHFGWSPRSTSRAEHGDLGRQERLGG